MTTRIQNRIHRRHSQTETNCPWDTIAMVPTPTVAGEVTSMESKQDPSTGAFDNLDLFDDRVRKPLEDKQIGPDAPPAA